ncbi:uncharacterized protein EV420DRAFT_1483291 [Desarmillaria tabescens]|uniref:Uncharacterized protein n=1 Tax=Armillaria tabescens TaxID=1929756 RepID=A0AA39JWI5_ARMTA|nr:uncharacterized protein EV420DRAFT_1483291 [Desarmillaria tabescens]KAK0449096.1 hypothetical protein EV420DRAFT_1483291 [Desarmillaria tabescens]
MPLGILETNGENDVVCGTETIDVGVMEGQCRWTQAKEEGPNGGEGVHGVCPDNNEFAVKRVRMLSTMMTIMCKWAGVRVPITTQNRCCLELGSTHNSSGDLTVRQVVSNRRPHEFRENDTGVAMSSKSRFEPHPICYTWYLWDGGVTSFMMTSYASGFFMRDSYFIDNGNTHRSSVRMQMRRLLRWTTLYTGNLRGWLFDREQPNPEDRGHIMPFGQAH